MHRSTFSREQGFHLFSGGSLAWLLIVTNTPSGLGVHSESITSSLWLSCCGRQAKASTRIFFFLGWGWSVNWNLEKNSTHLSCLALSHLDMQTASKFLSAQILNGTPAPSNKWHQVVRPNLKAMASLSHTDQFLYVELNFLDTYAHGWRHPFSPSWDMTFLPSPHHWPPPEFCLDGGGLAR